MQVAVSTTRPFHSAMLANALVKHGSRVRIYTSVTRRYFRRLDPAVALTLVPSPLQTAMHFLRVPVTQRMLHADSWLYDHSVATVVRPGDVFIGWASSSLATARAATSRGARYVVDRACPRAAAARRLRRAHPAIRRSTSRAAKRLPFVLRYPVG